jgi:hypothetical protein
VPVDIPSRYTRTPFCAKPHEPRSGPPWRARTLDRIVRALIALPEPPPTPPAPPRPSPEEEEAQSKAQFDELVRKLERFGQEEDDGGANGVHEAA